LRHEFKYVIPENAYLAVKSRIRAVMGEDIHGSADGLYRVTSLYFDDVYRSAYNDKVAGFDRRRKFRVRAYNLDPATLHLEIKGREGEYVTKRSVCITYEQYADMLRGDYGFANGPEFDGTAAEELLFSEKLVRPRPAVITDYFREAYIYKYGNVRVTFDTRLSTCFAAADMFKAKFSPVLNGVILEIKYDCFLPSFIGDVFSGFPLNREAASKFIMCSDKLTEVRKCVF